MVIVPISKHKPWRITGAQITREIGKRETANALSVSPRARGLLAEISQQPDLQIKSCRIERVSIEMGSVSTLNDWWPMAQQALPTGRVPLPRLLGLQVLLRLRDLPELDDEHNLPVTAFTQPISWKGSLWQFQARVFGWGLAFDGILATPVSRYHPLIVRRS